MTKAGGAAAMLVAALRALPDADKYFVDKGLTGRMVGDGDDRVSAEAVARVRSALVTRGRVQPVLWGGTARLRAVL